MTDHKLPPKRRSKDSLAANDLGEGIKGDGDALVHEL